MPLVPLAEGLQMSIDSSLITDDVLTLTEGTYNFECTGTNARPNAVIIWMIGENIIPPTFATFGLSSGDIRSEISRLHITEENSGNVVRCSVVSLQDLGSITESLSVPVTVLVNGKIQYHHHKM